MSGQPTAEGPEQCDALRLVQWMGSGVAVVAPQGEWPR
jgi:hypothetical protein